MKDDFKHKSSIEEIRARFDISVDRFSNLETGQQVVVDASLMMDLITQAAFKVQPQAKTILDIGCGAGNNTLKALQIRDDLDCDLVDLSMPMLERAKARVEQQTSGKVTPYQGDIRTIRLPENHYDVVIAAAVLHHLRDDQDWFKTFEKIYQLVKPGGSFWITDLVFHDHDGLQDMMWERYGHFLDNLNYPNLKDLVFESVEKEDSPRPIMMQLKLLEKVGFKQVEVLHKNNCYAAFGGLK